MPRSPFCRRRSESLSPGGICAANRALISCQRVEKSASPEGKVQMQVIGQNNDGFDSEWSTLAGRHERGAKMVNVFGQEVAAAFQQGNRKKERTSRNHGADVLGHDVSLTHSLKAGCAALSRPTGVLENNYIAKTNLLKIPAG